MSSKDIDWGKVRNIVILTAVAGSLVLVMGACRPHYADWGYKTDKLKEVKEVSTEVFEEGEHTISIPIDKSVLKGNCQYDPLPGYEPVAICAAENQGRLVGDCYGGGSIVYTNTVDVVCTSNEVDKNGNYVFDKPGGLLYLDDSVEETTEESTDVKEFEPGEHILSMVYDMPQEDYSYQYPYYEGYKIVGTACTGTGNSMSRDGVTIILVENTETVVVQADEDGNYTELGTPVEKEYSLQ